MEKYGVCILFYVDGEAHVEQISGLYDSEEEAQRVIDECIGDELETLQESRDLIDLHSYDFHRYKNTIIYGYFDDNDVAVIDNYESQYFITTILI